MRLAPRGEAPPQPPYALAGVGGWGRVGTTRATGPQIEPGAGGRPPVLGRGGVGESAADRGQPSCAAMSFTTASPSPYALIPRP
jgi:hypothetical protein